MRFMALLKRASHEGDAHPTKVEDPQIEALAQKLHQHFEQFRKEFFTGLDERFRALAEELKKK